MIKRIKIWLNSFSLIQQFLAVGLLTALAAVSLFFASTNSSIDTFVNAQMKSYLHRYEAHYISTENRSFLYSDTNVTSYVYSKRIENYISDIDSEHMIAINSLNPNIEDAQDGVLVLDDGEIEFIYSMTPLTDANYVLVSFISNAYVNEFKAALTQGVINVSIYLLIGLFLFFLVWVVTLIHPLNVIRDYIDKIKQGEKAVLNIKRNDEIGEVAEALVSMNEELSKQQRIREEMVQNISHDLKTPIATIKSYSESIKDGIYPYDTLEKSVDVIIDHANRLEKKAYNLNTFNKLGYLQDSNTETLMSPVIEKVILASEAINPDIKIETDIDNTVKFHGEEEPWRTVIENLFDNALRYAKTSIKISLKDRLLEIFNDGDQMSKDRIEKLFKPYEKGTKGNFGLGLSIVKKVCETYGYNVLGDNMDDGVIFRVYTNKTRHKKPQKNRNSK